jgi:hypothetical protein
VDVLAQELQEHTFEILKLEPCGEMWLAQFAIDGRKYPPFYEPKSNVAEMKQREFLDHMKSQSLGMMEYTQSLEAA